MGVKMKNLIKILAVCTLFFSGSLKAVEIVSFNAASSEAYVGAFVKGIKATAEQYGYDITVFENNYNQAEQNQQVEQYLASGALPDVFIWWPPDAVAGLGSLRKLAKTNYQMNKMNNLYLDTLVRMIVFVRIMQVK
jgi:ribose transport system substrate-binding protein